MWSTILGFIRGTWLRPGSRRPERPEQVQFRRRAFEAARKGDVEALQELMEEASLGGGPPLARVADPATGYTLLHAAMERGGGSGSGDCVRFLLRRARCELTRGDCSRETPLHVACMTDNAAGLEAALLAVGGEEPVDMEVADTWRRTPLLKAMVYRSERVLGMLLDLPVNLDAQDVDGLSLAHLAARHGRLDLVRALAARGASLNLLSAKSHTPLSLAIAARNPDMVRELLTLGASTSVPAAAAQPAVAAISEFIRRFEVGGAGCARAERVLHLLLAAHGYPLRAAEPDVFLRVLHTTGDAQDYLPLLQKLYVCSDCPYNDLFLHQPSESSSRSGAGGGGGGGGGGGAASPVRGPVSLFDLARRAARAALMESGCNVLWAVERLQSSVPPAVKGLLLLKDCELKEFPL